MAEDLAKMAHTLMEAFDKKDVESIRGLLAADALGVDEISRRWLHSSDEVVQYLEGLFPSVEDVRSVAREVHDLSWGDAGVVTFWLEQDYTLEGQRNHISAPTTLVFRREGGEWKLVLFHSIPLPESEG